MQLILLPSGIRSHCTSDKRRVSTLLAEVARVVSRLLPAGMASARVPSRLAQQSSGRGRRNAKTHLNRNVLHRKVTSHKPHIGILHRLKVLTLGRYVTIKPLGVIHSGIIFSSSIRLLTAGFTTVLQLSLTSRRWLHKSLLQLSRGWCACDRFHTRFVVLRTPLIHGFVAVII
jgi:hypothetical protein